MLHLSLVRILDTQDYVCSLCVLYAASSVYLVRILTLFYAILTLFYAILFWGLFCKSHFREIDILNKDY